MKDLGE
jgi:hypothetical protein